MEPEVDIFTEPCCLIATGPDGKLEVRASVLQELEKLERPLVVIAIAGQYRTGKSYLMNKLAGCSNGFALGSTIQSKTKGVWIWAMDHPVDRNKYVLLVDTEGLGDAEKGDPNHDTWIFCLATLLASTLVYNALGSITDDALAKLNFVTEMSKRIQMKTFHHMEADDTDFDRFFPFLIFVLRDFTLDLVVNGSEVTTDQYLEHCLSLHPQTNSASEQLNMTRVCIRKYFKNRKCFTFDRPTSRKKLRDLEYMDDSQLSEEFQEELDTFIQYMYEECPVKKLENGQQLNGRMLSSLVTSYTEAIRGGAVPCVENAVKMLSDLENSRAAEEGLTLYTSNMDSLYLPTLDLQTLLDHHYQSLQEAVHVFVTKSVLDDEGKFQKQMNERIEQKLTLYMERNEETSYEMCRSHLKDLDQLVTEKVTSGSYVKSGGYTEYQQDVERVKEKFMSLVGLGVKTSEALLDYIQHKMEEGKAILVADNKVTVEEKNTEAERYKTWEAEREKEAALREQARAEQHAQEKERAIQENIRAVMERRNEQMKDVQKNYELVLSQRLHEQHRLLQEGYEALKKTQRVLNPKQGPTQGSTCCIL